MPRSDGLSGRSVTVIGAGIGGLTAALAMARCGAEVRVIERADAVREAGAGLQISPNGMAVFDSLGIMPEITARSRRAEAVVLADGLSGREVVRMGLHHIPAAHPWMLVHRVDLVRILHEAALAAGVRMEFGRTIAALEIGNGHVRLIYTGHAPETAPIVIGADGVRSVARQALPGAVENAFTGQVAWRAVAPLDHVPPSEPRVFMAPGRHLLCYPLRDGRLMNIVAVQERGGWAAQGWTQRDDPDNMRAAFADFDPAVRALLDDVRAVHIWGLFKHPVARQWHCGRLVCLGDAVHPTLPFLAQGACMAIEDGWVLADALSVADTVEAGFQLYQDLRIDRCRRIVAAAGFNAFAYHLRGPFRWAGHAGLRAMGRLSRGSMLNRYDWLYTHDVTRGGPQTSSAIQTGA